VGHSAGRCTGEPPIAKVAINKPHLWPQLPDAPRAVSMKVPSAKGGVCVVSQELVVRVRRLRGGADMGWVSVTSDDPAAATRLLQINLTVATPKIW
jgi:hypothetical protein